MLTRRAQELRLEASSQSCTQVIRLPVQTELQRFKQDLCSCSQQVLAAVQGVYNVAQKPFLAQEVFRARCKKDTLFPKRGWPQSPEVLRAFQTKHEGPAQHTRPFQKEVLLKRQTKNEGLLPHTRLCFPVALPFEADNSSNNNNSNSWTTGGRVRAAPPLQGPTAPTFLWRERRRRRPRLSFRRRPRQRSRIL